MMMIFHSTHLIAVMLTVLLTITTTSVVVESFLTPPRGRHHRHQQRGRWERMKGSMSGHGGFGNDGGGKNGNGNGNGINGNLILWSWWDDSSHPTPFVACQQSKNSTFLGRNVTDDNYDNDNNLDKNNDDDITIQRSSLVRGGGGSSSGNAEKSQKQKEIVQGSKSALKRTVGFWKDTVADASSKISNGIHRLWPFGGGGGEKARRSSSKELTTQDELMKALETMPIKYVTVPNSTVLPPDVVRVAVKRAGIVGSPLRTDRVQDLAKQLKRWYARQGYILHSVTGATLQPNTATAEINVEEPTVSTKSPVELVFCKEMVVDPATGELMTHKQFYQRWFKAKARAGNPSHRTGRLLRRADRPPERHELNTTLVVKNHGRTNPHRIAQALKLRPGQPFQWRGDRWSRIESSGIFSRVLRTNPIRTDDGGIALQVVCMEPPSRHLEYGIGKSIWTNAWEGEIDFDWKNVMGGGESMGVLVRRGTKDAAPSIRLRYGDDKFGLEGGYDMEVFSDYIGTSDDEGTTKKTSNVDMEDDDSDTVSTITVDTPSKDYDEDDLLNRRGATFRLRNPISPQFIANSAASASVERTSTKTGFHESIGSASITLGPFRRLLPMDARSSLSTTITGGTRLRGATDSSTKIDINDGGNSRNQGLLSSSEILPYSSATATTRQILPLSTLSSQSDSPSPVQPITLALEHSLSTSTPNLPRHEAKAMGNACHIRGASPDGPASSALKGTTEIRIPVAGPPQIGAGTIVVFGDWFFVQKDQNSPFYSKSSIGVGVRKNVQGLPLKFDLCYSSDGKLKPHYSLGVDFDA